MAPLLMTRTWQSAGHIVGNGAGLHVVLNAGNAGLHLDDQSLVDGVEIPLGLVLRLHDLVPATIVHLIVHSLKAKKKGYKIIKNKKKGM